MSIDQQREITQRTYFWKRKSIHIQESDYNNLTSHTQICMMELGKILDCHKKSEIVTEALRQRLSTLFEEFRFSVVDLFSFSHFLMNAWNVRYTDESSGTRSMDISILDSFTEDEQSCFTFSNYKSKLKLTSFLVDYNDF